MEYNVYQYQATVKKIHEEALQNAEAILASNAKSKEFFGDEYAVKIQRHDGSVMYYVKEEVITELLEWVILQQQALEMMYYSSSEYKSLTKKEKACINYLGSLKPEEKYLKSLKKTVAGDFLFSYYRDAEAIKAAKIREEEKTQLFAEKWGF